MVNKWCFTQVASFGKDKNGEKRRRRREMKREFGLFYDLDVVVVFLFGAAVPQQQRRRRPLSLVLIARC